MQFHPKVLVLSICSCGCMLIRTGIETMSKNVAESRPKAVVVDGRLLLPLNSSLDEKQQLLLSFFLETNATPVVSDGSIGPCFMCRHCKKSPCVWVAVQSDIKDRATDLRDQFNFDDTSIRNKIYNELAIYLNNDSIRPSHINLEELPLCVVAYVWILFPKLRNGTSFLDYSIVNQEGQLVVFDP